MQLQAAFSSDGEAWRLINASPDLRFQIEANAELQPSTSAGRRNTPIRSIILTSADLDQVLGLLLLREFQPLHVYATPLVRQVLESNSFFRMLERVPDQLEWTSIVPDVPLDLGGGITVTPTPMPGSLPFYAKQMETSRRQASLALIIESGGIRLAYTPSLPAITPQLLDTYDSCDVIFVDGTFWSDTELNSTHPGTPLARSIGHLPMSGKDGSMALLAGTKAWRKVFVHINNTNPVLNSESAEYKEVIDSGWEIAQDGWQLN